ncbi:MAG: HlyC/CorC family transporter [Thermoplasmata archaeon]|nr:HlyC/CorC family transporter [Thermoplasmata archaeon]
MIETVYAIIIVILIGCSAFFSMSETAFTSVSQVKLKKMASEGSAKAERTLKILENYDKFLTTILIGNNLVNIGATSLATLLFSILLGAETGALASTVIMTLALLTFGEITPKSLAKRHPEKISMAVASIIRTFEIIFTPLSFIFIKLTAVFSRNDTDPAVTEDELEFVLEEFESEGAIESTECELIKSAIRFDDKTVLEILTPRVDIVGLDRTASMEDVRKVLLHTGYSRIPIYDGTVDKIIGVIYSKDFYGRYFLPNRDESIAGIIRRVRFIPETTTVAQALSEIQRSTVQMLVVVDDYGGTVGIVALEDVLEELVGEIWDESDQIEYDIVKESDGTYTVTGDANINDIMEEIGKKFDLEDYDGPTVGGFIQYKINKIPIMGDRIELEGCTMIVTSVRNRRVKYVKVIPEEPSAEEDNL